LRTRITFFHSNVFADYADNIEICINAPFAPVIVIGSRHQRDWAYFFDRELQATQLQMQILEKSVPGCI
jgi:hypothetical protein